MHEFVYADRILQSVLESARNRQAKVKTVRVEIGEMLGLTRESLAMAYGLLSKGTAAEGSKLRVRFSKGSVLCPNCGFAGRLALPRNEHHIDPAFACPRCGSSLKVTAGLESRIVEIT